MKTNDFSYFIERYNAGEMSDSEKLWFEKELDGNERLRAEVNLRKQTDEILKNKDVISLRNKLSSIENQRRQTNESSKNPNKIHYMRYAAVVAMLAIIGSITLFTGKSLNKETIMKQYYQVYEPAASQRSAVSDADSEFNLALEFYNTHDYERAAELFNKVLENKPNDMELVLLQGVSNFEIKRYPEAKQSFGKVIDDKNNLFIDQAQWYLALCYVNTNETEKAKQLFRIIIKEGGIYKDNARKIIRGLK